MLAMGRLAAGLLKVAIVCCMARSVLGGSQCRTGYNYPSQCPRPGEDPPSHTRCCRDGFAPACCEDRATEVCACKVSGFSFSHLSGNNINPPKDYFARWCPQPGQPASNNKCQFNGNYCTNITCAYNPNYRQDVYMGLSAILGIVFGLGALGAVIALSVFLTNRRSRTGTYQRI